MAHDPTFDPRRWAKRYLENADRSEANSMMDSGWSLTVANDCQRVSCALLMELFHELQAVPLKAEDFFDRPALAAVLSAVIEAGKDKNRA